MEQKCNAMVVYLANFMIIKFITKIRGYYFNIYRSMISKVFIAKIVDIVNQNTKVTKTLVKSHTIRVPLVDEI